MLDENRLNRIHVVQIFCKKEIFYVLLSDETVLEWSVWNSMSQKERWCQ